MTSWDEKRASDRNTVRAPAHLVADRLSVVCTILDVSPSGARLEVQPGLFLPKRLTLRAPVLGGERVVDVVWRNRTQVGVRFAA